MSGGKQRSLISRSRGVFYGWWIVVISFVVNTLTTGVYWLGFSVLFLPISRDLGVSRAAASLPFTLRGVVGAFQSPLVGLLVDSGPNWALAFGLLALGPLFGLIAMLALRRRPEAVRMAGGHR